MAEQLHVDPLVQQCYHYIAMNLEKLPVSYLSLLPLKMREDLLWRLPIADLCQLEDTEYVEGFQDMAAYWKLPCEEFQGIDTGDPDIEHYVEKWESLEYAKEILYGQVVTAIIGCLYAEFSFHLPFDDELTAPMDDEIILFLYAVRKPLFHSSMKSGCGLIFPPRYHDKCSLTSKKDLADAVVGCFKGEYPRIMADICLCEYIDNEYYNLLNKVVYLGIYGRVFKRSASYFVEQVQNVIQRSTCLEVVILEPEIYNIIDGEATSLDGFVTFLSTEVSFLSNLHLLKILTGFRSWNIVSQENLNKLVSAYFSAPTVHLQKIVITNAEIMSYDGDVCPVIDQCYLQFKTIELDDCDFVSRRKSTRNTITQWLGQDISTLHVEKKKTDSCISKSRNGLLVFLGKEEIFRSD